MLQATDGSPLLERPPDGFYRNSKEKRGRSPSPGALSRFVKKRFGKFDSQSDLQSMLSDKSDRSVAGSRMNASEVEKRHLFVGGAGDDIGGVI